MTMEALITAVTTALAWDELVTGFLGIIPWVILAVTALIVFKTAPRIFVALVKGLKGVATKLVHF